MKSMKTNKLSKVLMLGTKARGGMRSVVDGYLASDIPKKYPIKYIPTHIESNFVFKYSYFLFSFVKSLFYLANPDYKIVHMHFAEKGSFVRKLIFALVSKLFGKKIGYQGVSLT